MADRWAKADCLRDVFELLAREVPLVDRPNKPPTKITSKTVVAIQAHLPQVRALVVHRPVLRMIDEMISENFPRLTTSAQLCRPPSVAGMLVSSDTTADAANAQVQQANENFQLPFTMQQPFDYGNIGTQIQDLDVDGSLTYPGAFDFESWM
jgi:hypothetical protein